MISARDLRVRLGGHPAVDGVSLDVPAGQWLAVVGPNGAGKTTFLRCLADLVRHAGTVRVAGTDLSRTSRRAVARAVAYVPQQPVFPADMTAADYVLLGRTAHTPRFRSETDQDRRACAALLGRLGLGGFADRAVSTLSGGERQRLVLARCLAQDAPVLLLDEPTSALDLGRRVEALELVDDVRRERGLTVVSVIHDLTLAGQFADRLALMNAGRIAQAGPPSQVLHERVLGDLFGAAVRVIHDGRQLVVTSTRTPARPARSTA